MPKSIRLEPHLSTDELGTRYQSAKQPFERTRWHALWLLSRGRSSGEVAQITGRKAQWVRRLVQRYNAQSEEAVADKRHRNRGHPPLLSPPQRAALALALEGPAPDGENWNGPKAALWMSELLGRPVRPQRGWEALRRAGYTPQRPRPRHQEADPEAQDSFQAGAASTL